MRYEVTLENLQDRAVEIQSGGSNAKTVIGVALLISVAADALAVATGQSGLVGTMFSSQSPGYRTLFFVTLIAQLAVAAYAFVCLRESRWPILTSQSVLPVLINAIKKKNSADRLRYLSSNVKGGPPVAAGIWLLATFVSLITVFEIYSGVGLAVVSSGSFGVPVKILAVLAHIAMFLWLTIVIAAITITSINDRPVALGVLLGMILMVIISSYGSPTPLTEAINNSAVPDIVYWEFGVLSLILVLCVPAIIEYGHTKPTLILNIKDASQAGLYKEYTPFSTHIIRPAYLMFQVHGLKLLALARARSSEKYELVDVRDEQIQLPMWDRSLQIWNISELGDRVKVSFDQIDNSGYFSVKGSIGLLTTTAAYAKTVEGGFDKVAIDLITDVLFSNPDLHGLLTRPIGRAIETHVADLRGRIDSISMAISQLPEQMTIGVGSDSLESGSDTGDAVPHDGLAAAAQRKQVRRALGKVFLEKIESQTKDFLDLKGELTGYASSFQDAWMKEMLSELSGLTESHGLDDSIAKDVQNILGVVGLRVNSVRLELRGSAAKCADDLNRIKTEIEKRFKDAEDKHDSKLDEKDVFVIDMVKQVAANPHIRPNDFMNVVMAALSRQVSAQANLQISQQSPNGGYSVGHGDDSPT